jgi:sigma-B regulation protein RsbQ
VAVSALKRHNVRVSGGPGRTMLFAHGYGCDQNMWRFVAPAFESEFRVALFDYVGMGKSDFSAYDPVKYSRLDGFVDDLLDVCRELGMKGGVFVGHSVSSIIGILAAGREPDVFAELVLVGPSPCYVNDGEYNGGFTRAEIEGLLEFLDSNYLGWSSTMAPVIMGQTGRPELADELRESFCRTHPLIARQFARVTFLSDNRSDLKRVRQRALVIQCAQDALAPVSVGEYVHRQIPRCEFVLLNTPGHCPHMTVPAETIAAIKSFLKASGL